jgi:hypothetical protein
MLSACFLLVLVKTVSSCALCSSDVYKGFGKSFLLEGNNLAPGETSCNHSVQNIHSNAIVFTLKQTFLRGHVKKYLNCALWAARLLITGASEDTNVSRMFIWWK